MRKLVSLLALLVLTTVLAYAQPRVVTGRVVDEKGEPVEGASIIIKGTTTGASANQFGDFRITAKTGDVLVISALNFAPTEVKLANQTSVAVRLSRTGATIDEVVVTALGVQRQKKELGYATAKVGNAELNQAKAVSVAQGLQGKVSGLNITSINNGVFGTVKINLRGIRSLLGDNNPLFLLDGVQTALSYLSSINPNDIADVNILKGTSAAAIYGPDARNGVIIVTTKRGTRDGKPVVTVSHTTQLEKVAFLPDFQQSFGSGSSIDLFGNGVYDPIENQQYGPRFNGTLVPLGPVLEDGSQQMVTYSAKPGEKKKFWNTGVTLQNDVSLQGQNFYMSVQDVDISGVTPGDKNRRTSIRFNAGKEYGKFRANYNVNYVQSNFDVANQGANEWGPIQWLVFNTPMHVPLTQYKDWRNNKFAQFDNYFNEYYPNPYFVIDNYRQDGKGDDILANITLDYKPFKWLTLTERAAISANFNQSKSRNFANTVSDYTKSHRDNTLYKDRTASVADAMSRGSRISSEFFATATKTFNDFRVTGTAGHYMRQTDSRSVSISGSNLVVPTLFNVSNRTGEPGASEGFSRTRTVGVFGTVGFSYKSWANIEFTGRNDWVSILSLDNNSFFYPGVSASLVLSDALESIKNSKTISYLKLRGALNKTGTINIAPYSLQATFSQASGFPYGNLPGFTANNTLPDPNLRPEFIKNAEVGFEISFLRNRINLEVAAYSQDNTDQVIPVSTSIATGYSSTQVNAAAFTNKGIEFDLKLTPIVKFRKGNIELRTNFAINDSKISNLYQGIGELFAGGFTTGGQAGNWAIVGHPAFVFKALDYQRDPLGRVIVDRVTGYPSLRTVADTFGRTLPMYTFGATPTINYAGFSLSVVAEYKGGHFAYHGIGPDMDFAGISRRSANNDRQRFVFPNSVYFDGTKYVENTNITVANGGYDFYTSAAYNRNAATNYLTSASAWRIREASLGYEVPRKWLGFGNNVIKRANISVVARNLFLFLPKTNQYTDPDFNFTTGNAGGINTSSIAPPTRIFGGNLTLTF